jgi:L-ascorbate metabolism protein UlaG (beta-lactamase superfamily)
MTTLHRIALAAVLLLGTHAVFARPFNDPRSDRSDAVDADQALMQQPRDPACAAPVLVSTGGAAPKDPHTLALRWTGFSNYEIAHGGKVILLDAYFDRGADYPSLGFAAADVKKADVILIGHGHHDHMSDAASVGLRTGAVLVGAPITTDKLKTQSVPDGQIRTVTGKGGEILKFEGFTVEPILARHGQPDKRLGSIEAAYNALLEKPTPEQEAEEKTIMSRGTSDPGITEEGTIAYLITFDDGFRIMYRDSGGRVTGFEKAAMAKPPGVDLAIVALTADILNGPTGEQALEHMRLYKPAVFMPAHHDGSLRGHMPLWRATEPVFQMLKDANPALVTVSKGYREPVCFDTRVNLLHDNKP